jgi:hypothetical protein
MSTKFHVISQLPHNFFVFHISRDALYVVTCCVRLRRIVVATSLTTPPIRGHKAEAGTLSWSVFSYTTLNAFESQIALFSQFMFTCKITTVVHLYIT